MSRSFRLSAFLLTHLFLIVIFFSLTSVTLAAGEPVASYNFDQATGTVLVDFSGNGNHGTLANGPLWTTGKFNEGLSFDGFNDKITVANSSSINIGGTGLTLSSWVNITDRVDSDMVFFGKPWAAGVANYPYYQYGFEFDANGAKTADFYFGDTQGNLHVHSMSVPRNVWVHIAFTYDGTSVKGYVNGTLTYSAADTGSIAQRSAPVVFGVDALDGQGYLGKLDNVRIYNHALTASEIVTDMDTPVAPGAPDTTAPTISQIVPISTPTNDTTPNYTFFSTEAGTIVYGGSCSSLNTLAVNGTNIVTMNALTQGIYTDCTIRVTDEEQNQSNLLLISSFTIDTTNPTGSINTLASTTVSGNTTVTATAADNVSVASVQFRLDGSNLGALDTSSPYTISWNTAATSNGSHTLSAVVTDTAGNTLTTSGVSVMVSNNGGGSGEVLSYSTTFPLTENPIVEDGGWINAGDPFQSVQTGGGNAYATGFTTNSYNDNVAARAGWNNNYHEITATIHRADNYNTGFNHEIELVSAVNMATGTVQLYEWLINIAGDTQFARWDGAMGDFVLNLPITGPGLELGRLPADGDVVKTIYDATNPDIVTVKLYYNDVLIRTGTDSTAGRILAGNPGMSFFVRPGSTLSSFGFKDWSAIGTTSTSTVTDTTAPTITSISSDTANGAYNAGDTIDIDVTFSEAVTSTGNVTVTLETGTTDRTCTFTVSASLTGTCNYTVQAGDTSADLTVNSVSGTIRDAATNAMTNFTPATNLAANKALVIDAVLPTVSINSPLPDQTVSGTSVTVSANANDNLGVSGVQFLLDGVNLGTEDVVAPYSIVWDTTLGTDGAHILRATVRDNIGNTTTSLPVTVTVQNVSPLDTTPPTVPSGLTITTVGTTTLGLSWTASTDNVGVTSYRIYRNGTQIGTSSSASYSDTGLTASTTYTYTVRAVDAALNVSSESTGVQGTTLGLPPQQPVGTYTTTFDLTEYPISEGGAWRKANNAWKFVQTDNGIAHASGINDGYDDSYALLSGFGNDYEAEGVIQRSPTLNTNVTNEVEMLLRFSDDENNARGYECLFAYFGGVQFMRWDGPLGGFTPLPSSGTGSIGREFQTGDVVKCRAVGNTITFFVNDVQIAQGTDSAFPTGQPGMGFFIRPGGAIDDFALTSYTVRSLGVPDTEAPSIPQNLTVTPVSSSQINLNWSASTDTVGVTKYEIKRDGTTIGTVNAPVTSYSNTGLSASTTYTYTVLAKDVAGNASAESQSVSSTTFGITIDTTAPLISDVTESNITSSGATINWTTNEFSDSQIEYGTTMAYGSQTTRNTNLVTSHTQSISGLTDSTTYHYRIKSIDASGNLATSSDFSFTTNEAPAGDITSGLLGHWALDESTGTTASDNGEVAHPGTLANGPSWTPGKIGNALSFDGTNDYVTMGDIDTLDGLASLTLSSWIKTTSSGEKHIVDKSMCNGATNGGPFELSINSFTPGRAVMFMQRDGGSPLYNYVESATNVNDGNWHHITGTYDGANLRIYVDGVQSASAPASGLLTSNTNAVEIGGYCNGYSYPWNGLIDDVRIYNRALPTIDVNALYNWNG